MGEAIVITSGKGGVGKTTTSANLGTALALQGKKVCLVDTDIGLRNLDVILGLENRIIYDLVDVVEGRCKVHQALVKDKRFDELLFHFTALSLIVSVSVPTPPCFTISIASSTTQILQSSFVSHFSLSHVSLALIFSNSSTTLSNVPISL